MSDELRLIRPPAPPKLTAAQMAFLVRAWQCSKIVVCQEADFEFYWWYFGLKSTAKALQRLQMITCREGVDNDWNRYRLTELGRITGAELARAGGPKRKGGTR